MKLTLDGIKDRQAWEKAGIKLPGYDVEAVSKKAKKEKKQTMKLKYSATHLISPMSKYVTA